MTIYRKIWINNFGPIPKDEDGRSYEIHHIDGNRSNNCIENLKCVTIKEHYDIHYSQGDWRACWAMAKRMKLTSEEVSNLARLNALKQLQNGTHPWMTGKNQKHHAIKRVQNGTHNFLGGEIQRRLVAEGKHHLLSGDIQRKSNKSRLENGTHNFLNQPKVICPHCNKSGNLAPMTRWHFDNCKIKTAKS